MIWLRFSSSFKEKSILRSNPFEGKKDDVFSNIV